MWHFDMCRLQEPLQPPFKLRNSKWCSVSSLTVIEYQATSKGSDQTARMHRLIGDFTGRTYHIVGNLMHWLILKNLSYGRNGKLMEQQQRVRHKAYICLNGGRNLIYNLEK